ncbi:MAG: UDP-N-acetylmuramoyl-tripeptide--D-alanyl-D-alanine ligase [Ruminococcaceae bacterium]|nr:UDP-N-acetylmuramoyl-tripeptide--D-alanyl-D-alanine ligase [Oscillospiraceae bacterium]
MNFELEYIAKVCGGRLSESTDGKRRVTGFYSDSRTPEHDKLFLALRGERVDGNNFVAPLLEKGFCALTDRADNLKFVGDCIYVPDVRTALQQLAAHYRNTVLNYTPIIGITGSVGKTTTKDMVAVALSAERTVHKTLGNSNSQIGLPQTILATPESVDCAVVELGMSMPGEMIKIAECARPAFSIITNIGYSHIENLGTREAIRDEKLKISAFSGYHSYLILNGDEPLLRDYTYENNETFFVSFDDDSCKGYAKNVIETSNGVDFTAVIAGKEVTVSLNVKGKHFVMNSLFALAAAYLLDVDLQKAANALSSYQSDGKRQFIYESEGHTVISDCYNASPESMKASLSVLSSYKGRRIAVLGDMLELGNESVKLHRSVGSYVDGNADILITYGEMAKYIAESCNIKDIYSFEKDNAEELKSFLKSFVKDGDIVLYKASNGMNLGRVIV